MRSSAGRRRCTGPSVPLDLRWPPRRDASPAEQRSSPQVGMAEQVIGKAVAAPEGDPHSVCPECGLLLPTRDRPAHLTGAHGYLELSGMLLPRRAALTYLW